MPWPRTVSGLWICQVQLDASSLLINCRHPLDVHDQKLPVAFIECEMRKRLCDLASDFCNCRQRQVVENLASNISLDCYNLVCDGAWVSGSFCAR